MIVVVTPPVPDILAIQDRDCLYYWSAAAEMVVRACGVIGVSTSIGVAPGEPAALILTRGVASSMLDNVHPASSLFFEGPLASDVLAEFDVEASSFEIERGLLEWQGERLGRHFYPEEQFGRVGQPDSVRVSPPSRWANVTVRGQFLSVPEGWRVVARVRNAATREDLPVVIAKGRVTLCGLPIFDIAARHASVAAFEDGGRYRGRGYSNVQGSLFGALARYLMTSYPRAAKQPFVKVRRWPAGYEAAFSIRHDLDREIDEASTKSLLDFYETHRVRCGIGILSYIAPKPIIALFEQRGHEIQLHAHDAAETDFRKSVTHLRSLAETPIAGATIHGGTTSVGFLGDVHYGWAERAGLRYMQNFGNSGIPALPCCRVNGDGFPTASQLMLVARHDSLDNSTADEDHAHDALAQSLPKSLAAGEHVTLMNHPDIHRKELESLIASLDFRRVWRETPGAVVDWFRNTHFESKLIQQDGRWHVAFGSVLPQNVRVVAIDGGRARTVHQGHEETLDLSAK